MASLLALMLFVQGTYFEGNNWALMETICSAHETRDGKGWSCLLGVSTRD
jgi:hypothetical protein